MIYLASPYSHEDLAVRELRFNQVCQYAARLMQMQAIVFSPIAHTHPIAMAGALPTGWEYWEKFDTAFLQRADLMIVLKLEGWEQSKGIAAEIELAHKLNVPISFNDFVI